LPAFFRGAVFEPSLARGASGRAACADRARTHLVEVVDQSDAVLTLLGEISAVELTLSPFSHG
jgi:hypothetical protein